MALIDLFDIRAQRVLVGKLPAFTADRIMRREVEVVAESGYTLTSRAADRIRHVYVNRGCLVRDKRLITDPEFALFLTRSRSRPPAAKVFAKAQAQSHSPGQRQPF